MKIRELNDFLNVVIRFAKSNDEILALGLCGSYARGNASVESDVDLSIMVTDKNRFNRTDWIENLDFKSIGKKVDYFNGKIYGRVWSRHVFLSDNSEIEFCFAVPSWANTDNLDEGTEKVVSEGYKILYDPDLILKRLLEEVKT